MPVSPSTLESVTVAMAPSGDVQITSTIDSVPPMGVGRSSLDSSAEVAMLEVRSYARNLLEAVGALGSGIELEWRSVGHTVVDGARVTAWRAEF
jgi:hypothetical protein